MLSPGALAMTREDAMRLLGDMTSARNGNISARLRPAKAGTPNSDTRVVALDRRPMGTDLVRCL